MRRRLAPTLMVLLATAACATGSEFSPQPPPLYGEPKLWVPAWHSAKLANGLVVHVNPDPNLPLVSVALAIRGGRLAEPLEKAGLTYVLANSMITRTAHLSRPELAQVFDRVGGVPNVSVMPDGMVFRLDVLDDALPMAVKLLAALVMDAGSDETSLARVRAEHRGLLESLESSPAAAGIQGLRQVVYGVDHPLGLPWAGPHRTVAALTVADLEERYLQVVRPSNIVIAVAAL